MSDAVLLTSASGSGTSTILEERAVDLRWARLWIDEGTGVGVEDRTLANDRPVAEVAAEILTWLGWS